MKNRIIRKYLAGVLVGTMLSTMTVGATDVSVSDEGEKEIQVSGEIQNNNEESMPSEEAEAVPNEETAQQQVIEKTEEPVVEEPVVDEEPGGIIDDETRALIEKYEAIIEQEKVRTLAVGSYKSELAKFPASYKPLLEGLHANHPNWVFVAENTGLEWNDVVTNESKSSSTSESNRSLLPKTSEGVLLSKASTDYNSSTGKYVAKDGPTWVSASKNAVAYCADPRNFLTDRYIYMFESLQFDQDYHTVAAVENVLNGTDLYKKKIYSASTSTLKYGDAIFAAGQDTGVSPLFLAARIRQETGGKLTYGSISGNYSGYKGIYNFYNIGAYSSSTGSAIVNGLKYASTKNGTYGRPWNDQLKAIKGGAKFIASSYISKGQDTIYYERFNTVYKPYYENQYMQNLTAAASEANTTYNSYIKMGITGNKYVFYIPVYNNMPSYNGKVTIAKNVNIGKTTSNVTLRKTASTGGSSNGTIPSGASVTILEGVPASLGTSVSNWEAYPYWVKVQYGSKTGYVAAKYINMNADISLNAGASRQLSITKPGNETVYYESSNPMVAKVDANGKVTGMKSGSCNIYAISSGGTTFDIVGIKVSGTTSSSAVKTYTKYKVTSRVNYRSGASITSKKIGTLAKGKTIQVENGYSKSAGGYKWYRFRMNNKNYYVSSKHVKKSSSTVKIYEKYKVKSNASYRLSASIKGKKAGDLKKGKVIDVEKGYKKKNGKYTWYRFRMNNKYYYVSSKQVKKV